MVCDVEIEHLKDVSKNIIDKVGYCKLQDVNLSLNILNETFLSTINFK